MSKWTFRTTIDVPMILTIVTMFVVALGVWFNTVNRIENQATDLARTDANLAEFKSEFETVQSQNQTQFSRLRSDMTALAVSNGRIEATVGFILDSVDDIKDSVDAR